MRTGWSAGQGTIPPHYAGSSEGVTVRLHSLSAADGDAQGDSFPYTVDVAYTDAEGVQQTETLPDVENLIGSPPMTTSWPATGVTTISTDWRGRRHPVRWPGRG